MPPETTRLTLRELTTADIDSLHDILSDPPSMRYYPAPFTRERTERWIAWNLDNYRIYGFGLWAVILKENGLFLGDCGITMQRIQGEDVPEIGYHIHRSHTCRGYATEAARACRDHAFTALGLDAVYSYMKRDNIPSRRVAEKNGMLLLTESAGDKGDTAVYRITKAEFDALANRAAK